jgi:hypothetical protein
MPRGESAPLATALRGALRDAFTRFDEPALLRLRGELQIIARWSAERKDEDRAAAADRALQAVSRLYGFVVEVHGFRESRQAAEAASLFDLGSIGILAVENLLTEKVTPMRLLMSGLAEGLMFMASRQYVRGSQSVLEATYRSHVLAIQDELWGLAMEFRDRDDVEALREARAKIDEVFRQLDDPGVPVATRVVVLEVLFAVVVIVRGARLLELVESRR